MRVLKRSVYSTLCVQAACVQAACVFLLFPSGRRELGQRTVLASAFHQHGVTQTGQIQSVPETTKNACLQAGLPNTVEPCFTVTSLVRSPHP